MTENEIVALGEAPAVWWTKYTIDGWEQSLTLRDVSGAELLKKAGQAIAKLKAAGATPVGSRHGSNNSGGEKKVCAIHQVPMTKQSNDRGSWWSHKAVNDQGEEIWCKGK